MTSFKNIAIISDLDGTLLDVDETLASKNAEAIEYFKANGGLFTVATGRAPEHAAGAVPQLSELVNCPAITCNGACVYDFKSEETLFLRTVPYADILKIFALVRAQFPSAGIRASSLEYCFVCPSEDMEKPLIKRDLDRYALQKALIAPVEQWKELPLFKIVLRLDAEILPAAMSELKKYFGDELSFTQSWPTIIDIQPRGISKGSVIKEYFRGALGDGVKIYACGDYLNDIETLREADVAVCPSNAHPEVKKISDLCLCSNSDGLIASLVETLKAPKC